MHLYHMAVLVINIQIIPSFPLCLLYILLFLCLFSNGQLDVMKSLIHQMRLLQKFYQLYLEIFSLLLLLNFLLHLLPSNLTFQTLQNLNQNINSVFRIFLYFHKLKDVTYRPLKTLNTFVLTYATYKLHFFIILNNFIII